jgi:hypothetical protein
MQLSQQCNNVQQRATPHVPEERTGRSRRIAEHRNSISRCLALACASMRADMYITSKMLVLVATLAGAAIAFFPDLSSRASDITTLDLSGQGITEVPADAFARFTALRNLYVSCFVRKPCSLMHDI